MTKEIAPWVEAHRQLTSERGHETLVAALPRHLSEGALLSSFVTAIQSDRTKQLGKCTAKSLIEGVKLAAQLGLSLAPALGQMYLVPYKGQAQPIIGYRGLIALAYQSGVVTRITAHAVYENDSFSYTYGLDETLVHVPAAQNRGRPVKSYAIATLRNGEKLFVVCEQEDLERARTASRAKGGPWETHPGEMAAKTAIRRLSKLLPISAEDRAGQALAQAVQIEDLVEALASRRGVAVEQMADPWAEEPAETDGGSIPNEVVELFDQLADLGVGDPMSYVRDRLGGRTFAEVTPADITQILSEAGRQNDNLNAGKKRIEIPERTNQP